MTPENNTPNAATTLFGATQTHITLAQLAGEAGAGRPVINDTTIDLPFTEKERRFTLSENMSQAPALNTGITKTGQIIHFY